MCGNKNGDEIMATEYKDGSFSETRPIDEAMEQFVQDVQDGTAKALHVGSYDDVEKTKAEDDALSQRDLEKSMDELTKRLDDLEERLENDKGIIQPATAEQISKIINK